MVIMKTNKLITLAIGISSLATLTTVARPSVVIQVGAPPPPPVVVSPPVVVTPPAPAVTVETAVPDYYVWDGSEYVGVVGTQYYYLGAGNLWVRMDEPRLARFHDWEKGHGDWRNHATSNERYRMDAQGHNHPRHQDQRNDHGHE
jgi:hypothetical protein